MREGTRALCCAISGIWAAWEKFRKAVNGFVILERGGGGNEQNPSGEDSDSDRRPGTA